MLGSFTYIFKIQLEDKILYIACMGKGSPRKKLSQNITEEQNKVIGSKNNEYFKFCFNY